MSKMADPIPEITVKRPAALANRLFFRAYSGANPIGFVHLSTRKSSRSAKLPAGVCHHETLPGISYCLKLIEVSPNYRNQGVGSRLLDEVIGFCREQQVSRLYGEIRGEIDKLRGWYAARGFMLDAVDNLQLSLAEQQESDQ